MAARRRRRPVFAEALAGGVDRLVVQRDERFVGVEIVGNDFPVHAIGALGVGAVVAARMARELGAQRRRAGRHAYMQEVLAEVEAVHAHAGRNFVSA
jgi:hypothetical protein